MKRYLAITLFLAMLSGCATTDHSNDRYYEMATALTKLTAAVESTVRYKHPPEGLKDQALVDYAVSHDPSLLNGFEGYRLKVLTGDRHAIVLVCDADSAIFEDMGCTKEMDTHRWQQSEPCGFTLSTAQCP